VCLGDAALKAYRAQGAIVMWTGRLLRAKDGQHGR